MPFERFGGELPLGCDPPGAKPWVLPLDVLAFSHGRAALSWLAKTRGPFESAAVCAYTCPTVPRHLDWLGLGLGFFDYGSRKVAEIAGSLPGRCLVIVPATFGLAPWIDAAALARDLGGKACVVVDAAQSAFGALDFPVPAGGAVLSCPRKALALGDGALLGLEGITEGERASVAALPTAADAAAAKQAARRLFAAGEVEREAEALHLARHAERSFRPEPHRMTAEAREHMGRADRVAHRAKRRANATQLRARLSGAAEMPAGGALGGSDVPFNFPILHAERDRLLRDLRARRVFATPLWPDAIHDPERHPRAADLARRLVALPVDQRYTPQDMDRMADLVRQCL